MKKVLIFLIICIACLSVHAQKTNFDKIYLKDGSVLVGVLKSVSDSTYKIMIAGGSIFVIRRDEVERAEFDAIEDRWMSASGKVFVIDQHGWFSRSGLGLTFGSSTSYYGSSGSFYMKNVTGYKVSRYLQLGLSLSADISYDNISPIFAIRPSVSGEVFNESISPYYFVEAGYGFATIDSWDTWEEKGGFSGESGIGVKFYGQTKTSWYLEVSYRHQQRTTTYDNRPWGGISEQFYRENRLAVTTGFEF